VRAQDAEVTAVIDDSGRVRSMSARRSRARSRPPA